MDKIASLPEGEFIVSMVVHDNKVIVSTNYHIYLMGKDNVMRKVVFEKETTSSCFTCGGSGLVEGLKISRTCFTCMGTGLIK